MHKLFLALATIFITVTCPGYSTESRADHTLRDIDNGERSPYYREIRKLSPELSHLIAKFADMGATRSNIKGLSPEKLSTPLVKVDVEGNVEVYIHCDETDVDSMELLNALGLTTEVVNDKYKIVQGWLPYDSLEEAAELGFVSKITPPSYGYPRAGSVTTEGDAIMGSDLARATFGVDGSGIKVGVISNGIDSLAVSQITGDLPVGISVGNPGTGDEGTAILEIVHDIAPGADLAFHNGTTTMNFMDAVDYFRSIGADVIVDDVGFLSEPYFQDGSVAQAAADAVSDGIVFISAAGNDADRHYQALYIDSDPGDAEDNLHDFGLAAGDGSEIGMTAALPAGRTSIVVLQWTNPFGASSDDYDLFLVDSVTSEVVASSTDVQDGEQDPIEVAGLTNTGGSTAFFDIVINKFSGEDQTLEIFFNFSGSPTEFNVPEDSIYGHPAAPGVIAVGATFEGDIDFFSSQGPTTHYFNPTVTVSSLQSERAASVLEVIETPTIAAPNRVSTTVPGFFNFAGTSAAAPHVAGVAALVLQALGSGVDVASLNRADSDLVATRQVDEVRDILTATADDISLPGFDNISGFGSINAFAAVEEALAQGGGDGGDGGGDPGPGDGDGQGGDNNGGGGCSIYGPAGSNIGGTAAVNMMILLAPAFIFAVGFLRRKR